MRDLRNRHDSAVRWSSHRHTGGRPVSRLARAAVWATPLVLAFAVLSLEPAKGQSAPVAAPVATPGIVAVIEDESISASEFEAYFRSYLRQKLYHGGPEEEVQALRTAALEQLILDRLVAREIEQRDIPGDPQAVEQQIKTLEERYSASDRWAEVRQKVPEIRQHLLAKSRSDVLRARIEEVADPSEAQLVQFYDDNIELFTEPMAWDLAVILVGVQPSALSDEWTAAEGKGQGLYDQLLAGSDFGALAAEHSTHDSAASAGVLGLVHKGQLAPEIESALEEISIGEATPPIKVLEGYVLFQKLAVRPAQVQPFSLVMERARELYVRERKKTNWDRFTRDLRANAQITVYKQGDAAEQEGTNPPN